MVIDIIYMEAEDPIYRVLLEKWKQHNAMQERMREIVQKYGLSGAAQTERMSRSIGVERVEVKGKSFTAVNNDCVEEVGHMVENSVDLIVTSIPFSNHYEYTPSYNDFGHNEDTRRFFEQMDYLSPNLLRVLKPGRVFCCHVKDRVLFGNATGMGMPTMEPFHAMCIRHYMAHGFAYFGMITVVTDVVRENNQTYRLGWTEQCKDGSKMGVGCPEYILLFRKLPTDRSKAYADEPPTASGALPETGSLPRRRSWPWTPGRSRRPTGASAGVRCTTTPSTSGWRRSWTRTENSPPPSWWWRPEAGQMRSGTISTG